MTDKLVLGDMLYFNKKQVSLSHFKKHANWHDAYESVKSGDSWGFIDISQNFSQDTVNK